MPGGTIPVFRWPIVLDATNNQLVFNEGGGDVTAVVPAGTYFWRSDSLCAALAAAMDAVSPAGVYTVTILASGTSGYAKQQWLSIDSDQATINLRWSVAGTTLSEALCGFTVGADKGNGGLGTAVESDYQIGNVWTPNDLLLEDSEPQACYGAMVTRSLSRRYRTARWGAKSYEQDVEMDRVAPNRVFIAEELTNAAYERFFDACGNGTRFELCRDVTVPLTYTTEVIREQKWCERLSSSATLIRQLVRQYTIAVPCARYQG